MIFTGAAASYDRERGAVREDIDLESLIVTIPAQFDRTFGRFQSLIVKLTKAKNLKFFTSVARSEKVEAWSETTDKSRTIRSTKKFSKTKSQIVDAINFRTGGPSLIKALQDGLKGEHKQIVNQELNRFKASMGFEINAEDEKAIHSRVDRVFVSINQTLLRTVLG